MMKNKVRSISIDDETWDSIKGIAKSLNRSTSDYIRMVFIEHVNKLGQKPKKAK